MRKLRTLPTRNRTERLWAKSDHDRLRRALVRMNEMESVYLLEQERLQRETSRREQAEQLLREAHSRLFLELEELRNSEASLAKLNDELESQNAELKRFNDELEEFSYTASHDLQAPLRAIDHLSGWIVEDSGSSLSKESRGHLDLIASRARRMKMLLDDLLSYHREGRRDYQPERVDAAQLVAEVIELTERTAGLSVNVADWMPTLLAHRAPLKQVFHNLIANAVKHHDESTCHLEISARDRGDYVEFCVSDDGPGIAPEHHDRIFRMLQTLQSRDKVEGSGMGLALVKKIVERYGGAVQVESELGQGATFRFTWPKSVAPETFRELEEVDTPASTESPRVQDVAK